MCSETVLNVGECLSDYLKRLKDDYPNYQLSAVSLRVVFRNNETDYLTYSIAGDPILTDDTMERVCSEDLKDTVAVVSEDDTAYVYFSMNLVSKVTGGQLTFTDVVYTPYCVKSEESEVRSDGCRCNNTCSLCDIPIAPNIEQSDIVRDIQTIMKALKEELDATNFILNPEGSTKCNKNRCDKKFK